MLIYVQYIAYCINIFYNVYTYIRKTFCEYIYLTERRASYITAFVANVKKNCRRRRQAFRILPGVAFPSLWIRAERINTSHNCRVIQPGINSDRDLSH